LQGRPVQRELSTRNQRSDAAGGPAFVAQSVAVQSTGLAIDPACFAVILSAGCAPMATISGLVCPASPGYRDQASWLAGKVRCFMVEGPLGLMRVNRSQGESAR
jgi:hypothetical protein